MMNSSRDTDAMQAVRPYVAVIGAGPAGLMAAETLAAGGVRVILHDQMPSVGRKFLMAGRGGLNLTHGEALELLLDRYRPRAVPLVEAVEAFPPAALRDWCHSLGVATFEGSSGRIFPAGMKASPLLRAWLGRLAGLGVETRLRSKWVGFDASGCPRFEGDASPAPRPDATVLALGGASWPRLGSDGLWPNAMPGLRVRPWAPSNMGFEVAWSAHFRERHAGSPLKRVGIGFGDRTILGEVVITRGGLEGGAIYGLSAPLREALADRGAIAIQVDLRPDLSRGDVASRLASRPRAESLSNGLRKAFSLSPVAVGLVQEALRGEGAAQPLADLVKALPIRLLAPAPIARAISSAGGIEWPELDRRLMIKARPGVFACGEMLDWEAPTGGYLLQGCFSTGVAAGRGVLAWLAEQDG